MKSDPLEDSWYWLWLTYQAECRLVAAAVLLLPFSVQGARSL
jgi:hypothetical protein